MSFWMTINLKLHYTQFARMNALHIRNLSCSHDLVIRLIKLLFNRYNYFKHFTFFIYFFPISECKTTSYF